MAASLLSTLDADSRTRTLNVDSRNYTHSEEQPMLLIREIMYCKPGKVRPMVEKFKAMAPLNQKLGMPKMRIMTDFCAEQYWTIVAEMEVEPLDAFEKMMAAPAGSDA